MEALKTLDLVIAALFFLCYLYQFLYIPVVMLKKDKPHKPPKKHRFAVLICARNEESVIGDLIRSIDCQTYDRSLIRIFVMADNCTDRTAKLSRNAGAHVYERHDPKKIGKGYALEALMKAIRQDFPKDYFDGFFVFDADNVLNPHYIEEMNRTFSDGFSIITSYRNSKNYGDNWISAGYALWFLRESRFLNHARMLLGTSAAVSGTGFFFSRDVAEADGDWPFHLLTEDIEFTVAHVLKGERIAYCPTAIFYDEQPTSFSVSWHQRMRWAKGYWQVFRKYGGALLRGTLRGRFACFDMAMIIMPAAVLSVTALLLHLVMAFLALFEGQSLLPTAFSLLRNVGGAYLTLFVVGALTSWSEREQIHTSSTKKIIYTLTFPLFMFTYLPISLVSLFRKVTWRPIAHSVTMEIPEEETRPAR